MFTGLVEACVPILGCEARQAGALVRLAPPELPSGEPWSVALGDSVACSGCCLTVSGLGSDGSMEFELSAETLGRTWFGAAPGGRRVNLERSLLPSDRLGGHLVSGHVDDVGSVSSIEDSGDGGRFFRFEVPTGFERYLVQKGSVCIDGVSLTVVDPAGQGFGVAVIPETLRRTSLGEASVGDPVHLEADMVGKWIERLLAARQ